MGALIAMADLAFVGILTGCFASAATAAPDRQLLPRVAQGTAAPVGGGSLTASGEIAASLRLNTALTCPDRNALNSISLAFYREGSHTSSPSEPGLDLLLPKQGTLKYPGSPFAAYAYDSASFFYPSGKSSYDWSLYRQGAAVHGSGIITVSKHGLAETGSFHLTLYPSPTYVSSFSSNLAKSAEVVSGSWHCG